MFGMQRGNVSSSFLSYFFFICVFIRKSTWGGTEDEEEMKMGHDMQKKTMSKGLNPRPLQRRYTVKVLSQQAPHITNSLSAKVTKESSCV